MPFTNAGVVALFLLCIFVAVTYRRSNKRLPPGPIGFPILGNILDVPRHSPFLKYQEWSRQFGSEIISVKLLGTPVIILNSVSVARDLVEKRSSIYSDRFETTMIHELTGWERNFALIKYGELWRTHHRYFHQYFNEQVIHQYWGLVLQYTRRLLKLLLESPADFARHIRWMSGAQILSISYGLDIRDEKDPYFSCAETALHSMSEIGNVGSYLVDILPLLKYIPAWFPGATFKRQAAEWRKDVLAMYEFPFKEVQRHLASGVHNTSVAASLLEEIDHQPDKAQYEYIIQNVVGTAFVGGQETSVSTLMSFCLEMLRHPEIQRAAQAQLDKVVGTERLPEGYDEEATPLVVAIMWEVIRRVRAVPHKATTDDEYAGYHIPANSVVLINAWAMNYDESVYQNPEEFNPYRFLAADGKLDPEVPKPDGLFGYGRRACPGRPFATHALWVAMAHILATFNIITQVDADGNAIEANGEYNCGNILHPLPFKADFQPRFAVTAELIRDALSND